MSLPTQIQKQVDDARAMAAQLYGPAAGEADPADADTAVAVDEAPAPAEPAASEAPSPAPAPAPAAANTATPPLEDENNATYAQRWRTLQGKHNALLRQVDTMHNRIAGLEQLIAQMQMPSASAAPAAAPSMPKFVTDKDEKDYGQDMVDFTKRAAREEVAPLAQAVQALVQRFDQLSGVVPVVNSVAQQQQLTAREMFLERLKARVPDLATLNDDPDVHAWLLQMDPFTGIQRQTYLQDAEKRLDLDRVVSIFEGARAALGKAHPAAADAGAPAPAPAPSPANRRLESQVAPGRANAATPAPQQRQGKQWTRGEIKQFFSDRMHGKYKGKEAEATKLEQDIFKAQAEGRIVG